MEQREREQRDWLDGGKGKEKREEREASKGGGMQVSTCIKYNFRPSPAVCKRHQADVKNSSGQVGGKALVDQSTGLSPTSIKNEVNRS